jgi:hypothetical protein
VTLDRAIAAGALDREDVSSSALRSRSKNGGLGSDDKGLGWIAGLTGSNLSWPGISNEKSLLASNSSIAACAFHTTNVEFGKHWSLSALA